VDGKAKGRKGQTNFLEVHDEKSRPDLVDKFTSQIKRAGQEFRIQISEAIYIYIYIYMTCKKQGWKEYSSVRT
jgi:hypothetical protein